MRANFVAAIRVFAVSLLTVSSHAQTTSSTPLSLSTTLSQSIVTSGLSSASATSTSLPTRPTANSTSGETQGLFLWPPQGGLRQCERVSFAFTKPAVPLTCGIYVTNTSTYLEQVIIAPSYNNLVAGTFSWLVDMPVGLPVNVQVFVTLNGQIQQYTLPSLVVQEGQDNSCFGRNVGQNTQSIISYASSLNGSYVYTAPAVSSTNVNPQRSGGTLSGGAIAGIVIGVFAGLALLILLTFWLKRRQRRRERAEDAVTGRYGSNQHHGASSTTYAQNYAQTVMSGGGSTRPSIPPHPQSNRPVAEVMSTTPPPRAVAPGSPMKSEIGMGEGTHGLADPNSFVTRS
ncbi:hypothetical protein JCM11491_000096 [Sporobolomyces phaffii]